ncbi:MAG: urease accessory protein UreD [Betaproteobacteria bacterium]|nr:urease accessory protein UreD [Betaproteobacteria bacterium]
MQMAEPVVSGWKARLSLGFERRGERTVLASREHDGPLVVQKALYPEGDAVCHAIVVHPPAGIAGGDELELEARAEAGAAVLLTTPGAGKWYRSAGAWASQRIAFRVAAGATLEWLPQETIVFDGALADLRTEVELEGDATYIGWELLCFGRTGSGERFERGSCRLGTRVRRDGRLAWLERGVIDGGGSLLYSAAGLGGQPVCGTLLAAAQEIPADLVAACREPQPGSGRGAITALPGVFAARYLGDSGEAGRAWFTDIWRILRPALIGREAQEPRIWRT